LKFIKINETWIILDEDWFLVLWLPWSILSSPLMLVLVAKFEVGDLERAIGRILRAMYPTLEKRLLKLHCRKAKRNYEHVVLLNTEIDTLKRLLNSPHASFPFFRVKCGLLRILDRIRWLLMATPHSFHGAHNAWPKKRGQWCGHML